ncbi:SDR family oxidoreductase [Glaciecola sp. SC05]|uniref:SDR family oxidoreductase n=1 Tax=Glaciecola sp. SC05 TaxID=1987355 RepID=UPI0035281A9F
MSDTKTITNTQKAIVTGASGGIGQAIARELDKAGYTLYLHGRNKLALECLKDSLEGQHHLLVGDLNDNNIQKRLLATAFELGPIDLLVNNAGVSGFGELADCGSDMLANQVQTNLIAPMLFTQKFVQHSLALRQHDCKIVNVGSAFGAIGFAGFSGYCASKFGLRGFTEALSRELADTAIKVCYFAPRATQTSLNSDAVTQLNISLGNAVDSVDEVAEQFMVFLNSNKTRKTLGWPEKLFVRLNGCLPEVVDMALRKKLSTIRTFTHKVTQESL